MKTQEQKGKHIDAVVIFVDARGFTTWAEKVENFPFIDKFGDMLQNVLKNNFRDYFIKGLGDGAMLIKEINHRTTADSLQKNLQSILKKIDKAKKDFENNCKTLEIAHGCEVPLKLGWGITKGSIKKIYNDYIGSEINKSSRLCGIARPYGIVVDHFDFPALPSKFSSGVDTQFFLQIRKLKGISDNLKVWVTKEIANQFLTREEIKQTPEVHVAGICLKKMNNQFYVLIARRNQYRKLFPNLYEGCGGQLAANESFASGVERHFGLELKIEVDVIETIHKFYEIQNEPMFIPGISFLCVYKSGNPASENHSEVRWVSENELKSLPKEHFIPGLKEECCFFVREYKKICKRVKTANLKPGHHKKGGLK